MNRWVLGIIVFVGIISLVSAQELLVNGNFDSGLEGWTHNPTMDGSATGQVEVIEDGYGPAHGNGPYLSMACAGSSYFNQCIWQPVVVHAGDSLQVNGAFKDMTEGGLVQYWMELYVGLTEPVETVDYTNNVLLAFNWWTASTCVNNVDGTFLADGCVNNTTDGVWMVPDSLGEGDITVYFMIKTGIWQDGSLGEISYEVAVDSLTMYKLNGSTAVHQRPVASLTDFTLYPNYPNPFNPSTTIRFEMSKRAEMALSIYDINGRLIRNLMQETLNAEAYSVTWDGRDSRGNILPSGVYLCRLESGLYSKTQRLILMK